MGSESPQDPQLPPSKESEPLRQPPPIPAPPLNYLAPRDELRPRPSTGFKGQMAFGFLTWIGGLVLAFVCGAFGNGFFDNTRFEYGWILGGIPFIAMLWLIIKLRFKYQWRGFLPGVLIGFCITCLVPIGIIAVVCGGWNPQSFH